MALISIPDKITRILNTLHVEGHPESYVIGGFVRDRIAGLPIHDVDIFTSASANELKRIFPTAKIIRSKNENVKLITIIPYKGVEISSFRNNNARTEPGNQLIRHQQTCDFTINSIAADKDGFLHDPFNGSADAFHRRLKFVGNPTKRIREDPLRILRAIRFLNDFPNFEQHKELLKNVHLVRQLPKERISEELRNILLTENGAKNLYKYNFFQKLFPELKDVPINPTNVARIHKDLKNELTRNHFKIILATFLEPNTIKQFIWVVDWLKKMKFSKKDFQFVTEILFYNEELAVKTYESFSETINQLNKKGVSINDLLDMLFYKDEFWERQNFHLYSPTSKLLDKMKKENVPIKASDLAFNRVHLRQLNYSDAEIGTILRDLHQKVLRQELFNNFNDLERYVKIYVK